MSLTQDISLPIIPTVHIIRRATYDLKEDISNETISYALRWTTRERIVSNLNNLLMILPNEKINEDARNELIHENKTMISELISLDMILKKDADKLQNTIYKLETNDSTLELIFFVEHELREQLMKCLSEIFTQVLNGQTPVENRIELMNSNRELVSKLLELKGCWIQFEFEHVYDENGNSMSFIFDEQMNDLDNCNHSVKQLTYDLNETYKEYLLEKCFNQKNSFMGLEANITDPVLVAKCDLKIDALRFMSKTSNQFVSNFFYLRRVPWRVHLMVCDKLDGTHSLPNDYTRFMNVFIKCEYEDAPPNWSLRICYAFRLINFNESGDKSILNQGTFTFTKNADNGFLYFANLYNLKTNFLNGAREVHLQCILKYE